MNIDNISNNKDGIYLCQTLFTFIWANWAQNIKNAIINAEYPTTSSYHIPTIKSVDRDILVAPTIFLIANLFIFINSF